jgi:AhpD family alkylhydroperoxidase
MANLKLENKIDSQITTAILGRVKNGMGFEPNMYVKMGHNPALLDSYTYSYNSFRANSGFTPVEQEVVFLSVAYENNCEYCMTAHSFVADMMSKVPAEVTNAIRNGQPIPDVKLAALSKLTRSLTAKRGMVSQQEIDEFIEAGYTETHVLGIIAGIGVKTMSNYANHVTSPEIDAAFVGSAWRKY